MSKTILGCKRGRPATDHSGLVNTMIEGFLVKKVYLVRSELKVEVKCPYCKKISHPRLRDIESVHTKTCGCLRATVFWANCNAAVDKFPVGQLALIWEARFAGLSRTATCARFKLPYGYTDCAFKRYQTRLDELATGDQGMHMVAEYVKQRSSLASVVDKFHLSESAAHYVISATRRRFRGQTDYLEGIAQKAESMVQHVESRRPFRELGRPGELTPQELRRAKGKLLGSLASFYGECCSAIAAQIPQHDRGLIQGFIDLANSTLAQRLERQKAAAKRARHNQEEEMNKIWGLM